ncbi:MAG: site-2 protease family protein [Patescibacteria group bacterium]
MLFQLFLNNPLVAVAWIIALILSLTVHEFAHALVGKWRGDDTAELMGRLTLNPLAHLDVVGTLMLVFVGFGWAKPVPFNPRNLKDPLWDGVAIALAGPASNLFLAAFGAMAYRNLADLPFAEGSVLPIFLILLIFTNLLLLFFNLIPVPPLDGAKVLDAILLHFNWHQAAVWMNVYGPKILFGLVIVSLITGLQIFGFIQIPALFTCDTLVGESCIQALNAAL